MFNWFKNLFTRGSVSDTPMTMQQWYDLRGEQYTSKLLAADAIPAFHRGLEIVSGTIGKLPVKCYSKQPNNSRVPLPRHQASRILRRPNPYMQWDYVISLMAIHCMKHGNGYCVINRRGSIPTDILPINNPNAVSIVLDDGLPHYRVGNERVDYFDMLHFKGTPKTPWFGLSLIDTFKDTFEFNSHLIMHGVKHFENGVKAGLVLILPPNLKNPADIEAIEKQIRENYGGTYNANKMMMLSNGFDVKAFPTNNEFSQFIGNRQFSLIDISNITGVPASKLGSTVNTSYSSLTADEQALLSHTIEKWLIRFESELENKLLTEAEKEAGNVYISFNRDAIVAIDPEAKQRIISNRVNNGELSWEEGRALYDLPTDKDESQEWRRPANVVIIGEEPVQPAPEQPVEQEEDPNLRSTEATMIDWLCRKLERGNKPPGNVYPEWEAALPRYRSIVRDVLVSVSEEWAAILPEQRHIVIARIKKQLEEHGKTI